MEIDLKNGSFWTRKNYFQMHKIVFSRYSGFITHVRNCHLPVTYYPVEWNHKEWELCRGWEGGITLPATQFLEEFEPCTTDELGGVHTVVAEPGPEEDLHWPGAKEGLSTKVDILFLFEYFPRALEAVCRLSEFGEKKYSRGGFREVPDGEIEYRKAMLRHTMKRYTEGDFDLGPGGSNLLHGVAEAWNALAALEFEINRHGGFEAPEALIEQEERQP